MSSREHRHYRDRHRDDYSEVKPSQSASSSWSSRKDKRSEDSHHESRRKTHKTRSRSRSRSRERRRSSEREKRHHHHHPDKSNSRSPQRRSGEDRGSRSHKHKKDSGKRKQRSRSHSRSASRERERAREQNKKEVKLQMQRNYVLQLEKMKGAGPFQPVVAPPAPAAQQASKLVEQIQQRKLLFSKKPEEAPAPSGSGKSTALWKQPSFVDDADGKTSAKFKRLMGIKDDAPATVSSSTSSEGDAAKKQQQYFAELEKQYEVARATTHTQRGLGLGFGSSSYR